MARFNKKTVGSKTVNLAGGEAYKETAELELVSLLLTSFVNDKFYESAKDQLKRLAELTKSIKDKKFIGQSAVYARNEFGMRSITHALIAELVNQVKGQEWTKNAVAKTVHRVDDMSEMVSYYAGKYGKPIPNSLKKGLRFAFGKFDQYQLAKYRGENKDVKLVDLVNLVHPKPNDKNSKALKQLIEGDLKSTDTWEAKLTEAGKVEAETDEEREAKVAENKKEAWASMIKGGKLGYFALLRNLRNIEEQAPEVLDSALKMLVDEKQIKKSLVLPFRFMTAIDQLQQDGTSAKVLKALNAALELSLSNVPKFDGKTLIVVDHSGSMDSHQNGKSLTNFEMGAMFGAMLAKTNDADFMYFGDIAKYYTINPGDSLTTIVKTLNKLNGTGYSFYDDHSGTQVGHGTNFHSIFETAKTSYDRIFIFSDMQGWVGYSAPQKSYLAYNKKRKANSKIYSIDLSGHGTLQFPENNVYCLAGFSDKIFDLMKLLEEDRNALINKIKKIEL